jgi:hypothetical protein
MTRNNADFRNQVLFHGTNAVLKPGDMVLPGDKVGAASAGTPMDEAWATENKEEAGDYGTNVYQVQHVEPPTSDVPKEFIEMNAGNNVYSSKKGFRVVKQVR